MAKQTLLQQSKDRANMYENWYRDEAKKSEKLQKEFDEVTSQLKREVYEANNEANRALSRLFDQVEWMRTLIEKLVLDPEKLAAFSRNETRIAAKNPNGFAADPMLTPTNW